MSQDHKVHQLLVIFLLLALLAGSCDQLSSPGSGLKSTTALVQTIPPATLTAISAAAAPSQTPVPEPMGLDWSAVEGLELKFWYVWDLDQPGAGMNAIVDRFNEENEWGIIVNAVDQGMVLDPLDSIELAFEEGVVPHILLGDASAVVSWYQEGLIADLDPFLNDAAAGLPLEEQKDYYSGLFEDFKIGDSVRPGLPFTQTIQVIYYNQSWAEELGFSSPPGDEKDLQEQACSAAADRQISERSDIRATGILLSPEAANITSQIHAYDGSFINAEENEYLFSSPEVLQVAEDWRDLILEGCGMAVNGYPDPMAGELAFEQFNRRETLMLVGSSQMMGHIKTAANQTGRADVWEMLPFLGPEGGKAVSSEIQSAVIFHTTPAEELASWLFLKFLASPDVQADWVQYSKYYPTRKSSLSYLRDFRADNPHWSQGLNLLKYGIALPLDPSWNTVKLSVGDAFEEILIDGTLSIEDQLAALDQLAAELREYSQE
jgi:ABC-type glycerol-3-phosphate transport system substrate-binding protein